MKILVLGGAGFIGSNFIRRTLETQQNVDLTVFDALTYAGDLKKLSGLDKQFKFVQGDICDSGFLENYVVEADLVINFAAETHNDNSLSNPEPFIRTNIQGTFSVIQLCAKYSVRYHHISTDEVFGDLPLDGVEKFSRKSPYNPSSPYSASKAASDHLVRAWARSFGLRATISNCSNNYGPHQNIEKLIPRTISLILSGQKPKIFGLGANVRDWIHVDDHNDAIWSIIQNGKIGETYLIGANNEYTNLEIVQIILQKLGRATDFIEFIQDRPGHDLRYAIDASSTTKELGWQPKHVNFRESLESVIDYYL